MTSSRISVLFAHDHRFIPIDDKCYSESQFNSSLWPRYLKHFKSVTVVARKDEIPFGKTASQLELSSHVNVQFEFLSDLSTPVALLSGAPAATTKMHTLVKKADAVIARLPSEIGLLAVRCARSQGKPWAVEVVGCAFDGLWNYGGVAGKLYAPVAFTRMRRTVLKAPYALYVTNSFLQSRYPNKNGVTINVSNVTLPEFDALVLDQRLRRISKLTARPIRIGLIGTLQTRFKGIQTALAAIASIRGKAPEFTFHVLGSGDPSPWEEEAERLDVSDITFFEGTLPAGDQVLNWLDTIDLYIQPSFKEGLPRALIEAMSRGCPAVASSVAGIPELLEKENLFHPGDVAGFTKLLSRKLSDPHWMKHCARRNFDVSKSYDHQTLNRRRSDFWHSFVESVPK